MFNLIYLMEKIEIWTLVLLAVCIVPIAILVIVAVAIRIKRAFKKKKSLNETIDSQGVDQEQKNVFLEAYGGADNVEDVTIERNKISVKVKDIDLVLGDKLQELGATGVYLIGQEVRCVYGDRAKNIYKMLTDKEGEIE